MKSNKIENSLKLEIDTDNEELIEKVGDTVFVGINDIEEAAEKLITLHWNNYTGFKMHEENNKNPNDANPLNVRFTLTDLNNNTYQIDAIQCDNSFNKSYEKYPFLHSLINEIRNQFWIEKDEARITQDDKHFDRMDEKIDQLDGILNKIESIGKTPIQALSAANRSNKIEPKDLKARAQQQTNEKVQVKGKGLER